MSDLINRKAAIDAVKELCEHYTPTKSVKHPHIDFVVETLMSLPSAQPDTAKRIVGMSRDGMTMWYQCDMCNEPVDEKDAFCSGCGRRLVDE